MLLAVGACALVFFFLYNTRHDWKTTSHSLEKKKKRPSSIYSAEKQLPFHVFALKMDKFILKVKPKKKLSSISPQERAKQYSGKFHADNNLLFCSTCDVVVDHHRKSVLAFLASTFQRFHTSSEWMNPLRSERNNRHWRLHSSAKLHLTKRKWKSAMSGRNEKYVWCNRSLLLILFGPQNGSVKNIHFQGASVWARNVQQHKA